MLPRQLLEQSNDSLLYLSTNIPACTAWTILLNRGFSSVLLSIIPICRVKVEANQSRTSEGTESDWMSLSSSSVSSKRLEGGRKKRGKQTPLKSMATILIKKKLTYILIKATVKSLWFINPSRTQRYKSSTGCLFSSMNVRLQNSLLGQNPRSTCLLKYNYIIIH